MVDRGISENYVVYWLELSEDHERLYVDRIEYGLEIARHVARRGGKRSLVDLYDLAFNAFGRHEALAAEYLRRALQELADPTPVDDSLPPPGSWQWEHVRSSITYYETTSAGRARPPPRLARPPGSSR